LRSKVGLNDELEAEGTPRGCWGAMGAGLLAVGESLSEVQ